MGLNHRRAFSLLLYQLSYNRIRYSAYKGTLHSFERAENNVHGKFNIPHRGWYLAQARPDLTAKDPTSTRLVLQVGFEPNNPSFQALRLKRSVSRQLHHCSISRAGFRTCYDLFSHGDSCLEPMNHFKHLLERRQFGRRNSPMVFRMGLEPTCLRRSF